MPPTIGGRRPWQGSQSDEGSKQGLGPSSSEGQGAIVPPTSQLHGMRLSQGPASGFSVSLIQLQSFLRGSGTGDRQGLYRSQMYSALNQWRKIARA